MKSPDPQTTRCTLRRLQWRVKGSLVNSEFALYIGMYSGFVVCVGKRHEQQNQGKKRGENHLLFHKICTADQSCFNLAFGQRLRFQQTLSPN